MKYPKLPESKNRAIKLISEDVKNARRMHQHGMSLTEIALAFNVTPSAILLRVNDEYRERQYQLQKERREKIKANKPEYDKHRKYNTQKTIESKKYRRKVLGDKWKKWNAERVRILYYKNKK